MASYIARRKFLATLLGSAAARPRSVLAQASGRRALIAWLWAGSQRPAVQGALFSYIPLPYWPKAIRVR